MPKIQKHSVQPYDGAILRALRAQKGMRSAQMAEALSRLSGYSVMATHISGYEKGERLIPDGLIEAAASIFKVDPLLFPEYAARRFPASAVTNPAEGLRFLTKTGRFAPQRKTLVREGLRLAS